MLSSHFSCSLPDVDAATLSLEPDSISFMETLILREPGEVGLKNGVSPTSIEEDCSDAVGGQRGAEDMKKATPPLQEICPVGLHKAALLYPPKAQSQWLRFSPFHRRVPFFFFFYISLHFVSGKKYTELWTCENLTQAA